MFVSDDFLDELDDEGGCVVGECVEVRALEYDDMGVEVWRCQVCLRLFDESGWC